MKKEVKIYKVWYWEDGFEKIMYQGPHLKRATISARLWSKSIPNIETNFEYRPI